MMRGTAIRKPGFLPLLPLPPRMRVSSDCKKIMLIGGNFDFNSGDIADWIKKEIR